MSHAVLLVNLGSPDAPTPEAVRAYLQEFLSDTAVVDLHPWLWQPILNRLILPKRPVRLAPRYASIWVGDAADPLGAPLKHHTAALAQQLAQELPQMRVAWAMRYGSPSIADVLAGLVSEGVSHLWLLPLYPQHSDTTTETAWLAAVRALKSLKKQDATLKTPMLIGVPSYPTHAPYIAALAESVEQHWAVQGRPDFAAGARVLVSFHGLPERNVRDGDPYQRECEATHQAVCAALGLSEAEVLLGYQSRFGRQKWIGPSSESLTLALARAGCPRVDVICPGFAADCLETLDEVAQELAHTFAEHGGGAWHYIPCLNAQPAHIALMRTLVEGALADWQRVEVEQAEQLAAPMPKGYQPKRPRRGRDD